MTFFSSIVKVMKKNEMKVYRLQSKEFYISISAIKKTTEKIKPLRVPYVIRKFFVVNIKCNVCLDTLQNIHGNLVQVNLYQTQVEVLILIPHIRKHSIALHYCIIAVSHYRLLYSVRTLPE
jgi:hypothetical protein